MEYDDLVLITIEKLPTLDGKMCYDHKLFESRGCLLLAFNVVTISTRNVQLNVYEMKDGSSEWSVKYFIDIDYVMRLISKRWEMPDSRLFCLRCISVGERDEDSFIVMERFEKVVLYKFVLKTVS